MEIPRQGPFRETWKIYQVEILKAKPLTNGGLS